MTPSLFELFRKSVVQAKTNGYKTYCAPLFLRACASVCVLVCYVCVRACVCLRARDWESGRGGVRTLACERIGKR